MKKLVFFASLFCCAGLVIGGGWAQAAEKYPSKPITFIVPLEAGGGGDVQTRPLAARLAELLGQPVVVVNKPGAGSSIGYRAIHDAKADGYTIGIGMATIVANKLQ